MSSCTNESLTQINANNRIVGHLEDASRTAFVFDGNITDTYWVENDSIGVFTSTQQNLVYKALNSGKKSEFEAESTELEFDENIKVTAYYPYTDSVKGNNIKLPYTAKMKSSDSCTSFMFSNSVMKKNELNLYFNHLYAYLQVKLSTNVFTDYFSFLPDGGYKKEGFAIYVKSDEYISTSSGWFNIETNEVSYDENGAKKTLYYECDNININSVDTFIYMLPILPQAEGTNVNVSVVVPSSKEGYVYMSSLISKETPAGGFQAGHVYTINTVDKVKPSSEQYKILEELYTSTNGHLWRNNHNWLTDKTLKEWYGLNEGNVNNTYVNNIKLGRNILTGKLPESFAKLMDCAQYIDLSFNGISGDIPDSVKKHTRWKEVGWNIIAQDTRLSDGFNLNESNLYLPQFKIFDILDSCEIDMKKIISNNKFTQLIMHTPNKINDIKDLFTESQVNLHLDYNKKGLSTIIVINTNGYFSDKSISDYITKTYGKIKGIYWVRRVNIQDSINASIFLGMSYTFNNEGQLIYFAPYYFEPYIWYEYLKENDVVHQKYGSFMTANLGEPTQHEEFKYKE